MNRRIFLTQSSALVAAVACEPMAASATTQRAGKPASPTISVFTKPFVSLDFATLAHTVREMGFDGLEAPIRKGGHIDPENVESQLPQFVESIKREGLEVTLIASDINTADETAERVLKVAKSVGITRYRLKYFKYDKQPIKKQLANWTSVLKDLAALNKQYGMTGVYQNHAGNRYFGAAIWDLAAVLDDVDSPHLKAAYDIRHATAEGGLSWPVTMRRIISRTDILYVKDFRWDSKGKLQHVPLGTGQVDAKFYSRAIAAGFQGPISLHEEYLPHADPQRVPDHVVAMKRDLRTLRAWIKKK